MIVVIVDGGGRGGGGHGGGGGGGGGSGNFRILAVFLKSHRFCQQLAQILSLVCKLLTAVCSCLSLQPFSVFSHNQTSDCKWQTAKSRELAANCRNCRS